MAMLNTIHAKMHKALAQAGGRIDAVFFCPHPADSQCECRKPKAGMFREIAQRYHMDLTGVAAIGDALRDIEVARSVGALPILVKTGKGTATLAHGLPYEVPVFDDLARAVAWILGQKPA